MSFQGLQAKYRRLYNESAAWKLLRAENAPYIMAFLADLFAEENEVPVSRARVALEAELTHCRELGIWETQVSASSYISQWTAAGWLRDMDDKLSKTDASEIAFRFCQGLDERNSSTTASHLKIVQEAVRDFAVAISPNIYERVTLLEYKKAEIQREIDALNNGVVKELNETEQRERIREIYQLASVLTGDFRRVEDEIRQLGQDIRVQIIEEGAKRGEVLLAVMEKEALLATTEAGSAFEGFFQLLCDQNRTSELREQLRSILSRPAAEHLAPRQRHFLAQLMRELSRESDHVFHIRRRTEESLRSYIESGAAQENRAVDKLLQQLERIAVKFKDANISPEKTTIPLILDVGAVEIKSPESMRLRTPEEKLDTSGIEEKENSQQPSDAMLDCLDAVQVREVAQHTLDLLLQHGPMSVSKLVQKKPINSGLEELVAYLRVAKALSAPQIDDKEHVEFSDKHGNTFKANIPKFLLTSELFPDNIDELII